MAIAENLYRASGVAAPWGQLYQNGTVLLSEYITGPTLDDLLKNDPGEAADVEKTLSRGFAIDASLDNTDVLGKDGSSIVVHDGVPWRTVN